CPGWAAPCTRRPASGPSRSSANRAAPTICSARSRARARACSNTGKSSDHWTDRPHLVVHTRGTTGRNRWAALGHTACTSVLLVATAAAMHADIAPGPSRRELVFRWPKLHAQPLAELEALWRRYGDVVRVPVVRDYFLLVDPAAIRRVLRDNRKNYDKADSFDDLRLLVGDGLLTARADAWVAQRRLLAKVF